MLEFHSDCGFDSEDELIDYLESQRNLALLADDDDAVSSFEQDLSLSYAEVTESIDGASLYIEYISPQPLNEVTGSNGYSLEATIVSPEIVFWDPGYMDEDEEWDEYFDYLKDHDFFVHGEDVLLKLGVDPATNPILSALIYSNDDYDLWKEEDESLLSTIPVGLPKHGLNASEIDLSENKWVFRLFGKISGVVSAQSVSDAKTQFARVIKESFTFIDSDYGTNKFGLHEFLDGQEKVTINKDSLWLIPIEHVFVNLRKS